MTTNHKQGYWKLNVEIAKQLPTVATGLIPNGYFGRMTEVTWKFDAESGKTITLWASGYFNSHLPDALDLAESEWLVRNHPNAREWVVRTSLQCPVCGDLTEAAGMECTNCEDGITQEDSRVDWS